VLVAALEKKSFEAEPLEMVAVVVVSSLVADATHSTWWLERGWA